MSSHNNNNGGGGGGSSERLDDYLARHPVHVLGSTAAVANGGGGGGSLGAAACGFSGEHLVLAHQFNDLSRRVATLEQGGGGGGLHAAPQNALANPAPLGLWVRLWKRVKWKKMLKEVKTSAGDILSEGYTTEKLLLRLYTTAYVQEPSSGGVCGDHRIASERRRGAVFQGCRHGPYRRFRLWIRRPGRGNEGGRLFVRLDRFYRVIFVLHFYWSVS